MVHSKHVVLAALLAGVMVAGCRSNDRKDDGATTQAAADTSVAPAGSEAKSDVAVDAAAGVTIPTPPAERDETPGPSPNATSVWYHGFWHWDTGARQYQWMPGYWQDRNVVATVAPPPARVELLGPAPGTGYTQVPGFWRWSGREYAWVPGHWAYGSIPATALRPRYENVNGRWMWRDEGYQQREEMRLRAERERGERERLEHDRVERERVERERGERERNERERNEHSREGERRNERREPNRR